MPKCPRDVHLQLSHIRPSLVAELNQQGDNAFQAQGRFGIYYHHGAEAGLDRAVARS